MPAIAQADFVTHEQCTDTRRNCSSVRWRFVLLIWGLVGTLAMVSGGFILASVRADATHQERIENNKNSITRMENAVQLLPQRVSAEVRAAIREELARK